MKHHPAVLGFLVLVAMVPMLPAAMGESSLAFVEQISEAERTTYNNERQAASFSTPGEGLINAIETGYFDDLSLSPPEKSNVTYTLQYGNRNRAVVSSQGDKNLTYQRQVGDDLESHISLVGRRNAIVVDQKGSLLTSDIVVVGGNKKVLHLQRGENIQNRPPLVFSGSEHEASVVLDTPHGRISKAISE